MNKINAFLGQFTAECLETIALLSYDWLVTIGLIGLVLWIFGLEKGKDWAILSPVLYIILQILIKVLV